MNQLIQIVFGLSIPNNGFSHRGLNASEDSYKMKPQSSSKDIKVTQS